MCCDLSPSIFSSFLDSLSSSLVQSRSRVVCFTRDCALSRAMSCVAGCFPCAVVCNASRVCQTLSSRASNRGFLRKKRHDARPFFARGRVVVAPCAKSTPADSVPMTRREARDAHFSTRHAKLVGNENGARVSRDTARVGLAVETVRLAGGVETVVRRALELSSRPDERWLEAALGLANAANVVAGENTQSASKALAQRTAKEEGEVEGKGKASGKEKQEKSQIEPNAYDEEPSSAALLENKFQELSLVHGSTQSVVASIEAKLKKRLLHDEWLASISAIASVDWRRDRKKPKTKAKVRGFFVYRVPPPCLLHCAKYSIHFPIPHRWQVDCLPIQYTHTSRVKTDTLFYPSQGPAVQRPESEAGVGQSWHAFVARASVPGVRPYATQSRLDSDRAG